MNKTPEEIIIEKYGCSDLEDLQKCFLNDMISFSMIREAMEEYGKQQYNQAIKDAAENAKAKVDSDMITSLKVAPYVYVDKESILKLLKP